MIKWERQSHTWVGNLINKELGLTIQVGNIIDSKMPMLTASEAKAFFEDPPGTILVPGWKVVSVVPASKRTIEKLWDNNWSQIEAGIRSSAYCWG